MKKKIVAFILALTMLSTMAYAADTKFSDVPDNHWAASSIYRMVDAGVVNGIGGGKFNPNGNVSCSEFIAMITRQFYNDKIKERVEGTPWYTPNIDAANAAGIMTDVTIAPSDPMTRYEMALVMYNVMKANGFTIQSLPDASVIADWANVPGNYQSAVSACYKMGLLTGTDSNGTFGGAGNMRRSEAAIVMCRLIDANAKTPHIPTESTPVTPAMLLWPTAATPYENGVYTFKDNGITGSGSIHFKCEGYSTVTFTVKANDMGENVLGEERIQTLNVYTNPGALYGIEDLLLEDLVDGVVKTYTVDLKGASSIGISVTCGAMADAELWNVYLSK